MPVHLNELLLYQIWSQYVTKARCVVGKWHFICDVRVRRLQTEIMHHARTREGAVVAAVKIDMLRVQALFRQEVVDSGTCSGIEVATDQEGDLCREMCTPLTVRVQEVVCSVLVGVRVGKSEGLFVLGRGVFGVSLGELADFLHHDSCLNEFDVFVGWVPDDMCIHNDQTGAGLAVLEEHDRCNVVALPHAIQHIGGSFCARTIDCFATEDYVLRVELDIFLVFPERTAAVYESRLITKSLCA